MNPIPTVATVMTSMEPISAGRRPAVSPIHPNSNAPAGRATDAMASVAKEDRIPEPGSRYGKKTCGITTAAPME